MSIAKFDVVVVGAGIVGATLAQLLAKENLTVAVVEKGDRVPVWEGGQHDSRVSAISVGSERVLSALGVWDHGVRRRVSPYERMYVWDAGSRGQIEFQAADLGVSHLGSIVENSLILSSLHDKLRSTNNVSLFMGVAPKGIEHEDNSIILVGTGLGRLRASVLVGADGAGSKVRSRLGIRSRALSFGQSAIIAQVSTELSHQKTAWQRFLPSGPLAFLPLSNGDSSIVWSCEQELADELMALDDIRFADRLGRAFENRLGEVVRAGPRTSLALSSAHADSYVAERAVLIGDAAHVVHPLAGQGVNLGITDAAALAEVLAGSHAGGRDIGSPRTLRRYERWRKADNLGMVNALVGFKKLFGSDSPVLSRLRGTGMRLVDTIGPIKNAFAYKALGLKGDLPALMTGGVPDQ